MELAFVPVENFYFALTLGVKTLEDIEKPGLVEQVRSILQTKFGQPSTVAPGHQNTFNYVFQVTEGTAQGQPLVVSISDWQDKVRLSSDYGWTIDPERKPVRTGEFGDRSEFSSKLKFHLQELLQIEL
jgi:hypothetical protein